MKGMKPNRVMTKFLKDDVCICLASLVTQTVRTGEQKTKTKTAHAKAMFKISHN